MRMNKAAIAMDDVFLEDWIVAAVNGQQADAQASLLPNQKAPAETAQHIAYSWTQVRDCVQQGVLQPRHIEGMDYLLKHSRALHVAEPQAKLLVSLFTSVSAEDRTAMARVRRSAALILSIYIRRTLKSSRLYASSKPFLLSTIHAVCKSLEDSDMSDQYVAAAILLLGSLCILSECEENHKETCRRVIIEELDRQKEILTAQGLLHAFSGVGYAMVGAHDSILTSVLTALLGIWTPQSRQNCKNYGIASSLFVKQTLMLLHLMEFQGIILQSYEESIRFSDADAMLIVLRDGASEVNSPEVRCASVMASCGLLKSFRNKVHAKKQPLSEFHDLRWLDIRVGVEGIVSDIARQIVTSLIENKRVDTGNRQQEPLSSGILQQLIKVDDSSGKPSPGVLRQLQCTALGVSRIGSFSADFFVTCCLLYILFLDVLNLAPIYSAQITDLSQIFALSPEEKLAPNDRYNQSLDESLNLVKENVEGCLFQEVGAIARAICEQYQIFHPEYQKQIVTSVWEYCRAVYDRHRIFVALCSEDLLQKHMLESSYQPHQMLKEENIAKILEAYFLSIVLFFATVLEHKTLGKQFVEKNNSTETENFAVQILDSVSCVEFYRQLQVPEYTRLIQRSVSSLCASKQLVAAFVVCLPSYSECTQWPKCLELGFASYDWKLDQVQAARVHFYFRILCSCLGHISDSTFKDVLSPTMFLYIQHCTEPVARSSHALFTTFLSLDADRASSAREQETSLETLREQLAVEYIQRSLEAYPYISSFEGMTSGVGAIACHLPPGSPATIHCIDSLVNKISGGASSRNWEKESCPNYEEKDARDAAAVSRQLEAVKKIRTLLVHLILLVDLQVLPHLLKQVAKVVLGLQFPERTDALGKVFDIVLGTDDYTRKPILVPWLLSLSFMCSKL